ncbi:unnamed protein product [Microthlaspi erraticum]|uniref:Uncharacterized protein n=1 Tax=Microthlaspi erraticum TaxID=1685480 RepID=A0A6D2INQ2_9BRAS|nr:unnamed protein product [Microthlaspi erraticum]
MAEASLPSRRCLQNRYHLKNAPQHSVIRVICIHRRNGKSINRLSTKTELVKERGGEAKQNRSRQRARSRQKKNRARQRAGSRSKAKPISSKSEVETKEKLSSAKRLEKQKTELVKEQARQRVEYYPLTRRNELQMA